MTGEGSGAGLVVEAPDLDGVVPAARVEGGVVGGQSQGADVVGVTGEGSGAGLLVMWNGKE